MYFIVLTIPMLEIHKWSDPFLKMKCEPVEEITDEIKELISEMLQTMKENNGAGLAANQVGSSHRLFVIGFEGKYFALINPEMTQKTKEEETELEGCLSFPNEHRKIKRPIGVQMKYLNILGEEKTIKCEGVLARALQHEYDHLNGITFRDRVSGLDKIGFLRKIKRKIGETEIEHIQ